MKSVRCSGYRSDNKRCAKRVFPNSTGYGWCTVHGPQMPVREIAKDEIRCDICFDDMSIAENANFECGHYFHLACAKKLRDPRCPVCRSPIKSNILTDANIAKIQERCLKDQYERDSHFIEPANFDEIMEVDDDSARESFDFEFELQLEENTTISQIYQQIINNYRMKDPDETPVLTVIISIIGGITVMSHIANIEIPRQELREWLVADLADLYPDENQDSILEAINIFI